MITSSVDKIILFVANFALAEMTFKVAVMASLLDKITFVVTEITFLGTDIRLLVAKITFVATEITFKVAVITS